MYELLNSNCKLLKKEIKGVVCTFIIILIPSRKRAGVSVSSIDISTSMGSRASRPCIKKNGVYFVEACWLVLYAKRTSSTSSSQSL